MNKFALKAFLLVYILIAISHQSNVFSQDLATIKDQKPFTLSGDLGISAMFYNVEGRPANREPFTWMINGSPTLNIYGIIFPFSFTVSEQERDFRQPFNKFGVSPTYKWIKLHLGYRNIEFSPYTLGGHSILGIGAELNPGKVRFGFITGRLMRAVSYNADPLNLGQSGISTPSFQRNGYSLKLGYGTAENFVDFILLKGRDDPFSINSDPQLQITPAENVVWSLVTRQKINKWASFSLEYANSVYTRDVRSDAADSIFSTDVAGLYNTFIKTNATTKTSSAIDGAIELNFDKYLLNLRYKRIAPEYQSMGSYYFQNDMRNITIEPTAKLVDDKLTLSASIGLQRDNLGKTRNFQTNRTISSFHVTWQPIQIYQADVSFSNYDMGQKKGLVELDTLYFISQTTANLMVNQSLSLTSEKMMHSFMLSYNYQKLNDKNPNTADNSEFSSNVLFATWSVTLIKPGITGGLSYNYSTFDMLTSKTKYLGPSLSIGKSMFKQKVNLSFNWASYKYFTNNEESSNVGLISMRGAYRMAKKHKLQMRYTFNKSIPKNITVNKYKETKGDISYVYTF